jgi:Plavaka transposase
MSTLTLLGLTIFGPNKLQIELFSLQQEKCHHLLLYLRTRPSLERVFICQIQPLTLTVGLPNERGYRHEDEGVRMYREYVERRRQGSETDPPCPYYPFRSKSQFKMVKHHTFPEIKSKREIQTECVIHRDSWTPPDVLFRSTGEYFRSLDSVAALRCGWKEREVVSNGNGVDAIVVRYWYRDPLAVVQDILGDQDLANDFIWAPSKSYDQDGNRIYTELSTGEWWWSMQSMLHPGGKIPREGSCTVVPIILSSDKILFGALSGTNSAWPLYITVGNVPSSKRWLLTKPYARLIALLPDLSG